MIPSEQLRAFEEHVWFAVELTLQDRTRDGYLVLDEALASVEGSGQDRSMMEELADLYRKALVEYADAHGFDPEEELLLSRPSGAAGGPDAL